MPPIDDEPTWEVLPVPHQGTEIDRYRPPAKDRLDPVVIVGRAETQAQRLHGVTSAAVVALLIGGPLASLGPRNALSYVAVGAVMVAIVSVRLVQVLRRPLGCRPEVTVSAEGLSAIDAHGITRTATWSDVGNLFIGWYSNRRVRELYVTWIEPSGTHVVVNLGDSLDLMDVRRTLLARAPEGVNLRLGAQREYGSG
jgi:hypothetical protein